MGLNISIERLEGHAPNSHPHWDDGKYSGDREAAAVIFGLPCVSRDTATIDMDRGIHVYYRPADFAAWRAAPWPEINQDRWAKLIDILENEPEYWLYFSI